MTIKQISVFLENTAGRLAEVARLLGDDDINCRAISIADTADFGILRIIVNKPDEALKILEKNGFTAKVTEVLGIEIDDKPGSLSEIMEIFNKTSINIEYLYATLEGKEGKAVIIFKIADIKRGEKILKENNLKTISVF